MSSCRELVVLVKGIGMGLRSVLSTLRLGHPKSERISERADLGVLFPWLWAPNDDMLKLRLCSLSWGS